MRKYAHPNSTSGSHNSAINSDQTTVYRQYFRQSNDIPVILCKYCSQKYLIIIIITLSLQDDILTESAHCNSNFLQSCLAEWLAKFGDVPDTLPTKQPFWDLAGVLESKAKVEASLASAYLRASFLAASCQHSWHWLFALSITSCGLKLDDEAVRIAVGLRRGLDLCIPHECHCGSPVDAHGLHSFVCRKAPAGRLDTMLSMTWSLEVLP